MSKSSLIIARCLLAAVLLACSVKAIQFDCDFQTLDVRNVGDRYSCNARVINSGSASLESVTGVHQSGKSNDNVGFLWINEQYLPLFPEGITNFFKNLDALRIGASSLRTIRANDLRPFSRLVLFQLWADNLTSVDGDLFTHTQNLHFVSFSNNQIQHIGYDLVTNLNNLRYLDFSGNVCIYGRVATSRAQVLSLASQLSVLCPPLDVATTKATNTTETAAVQCLCDKKIDELLDLNRALGIQVDSKNRKIEQQSKEIAAFEKKLLEVEMKLLEIESMPESYIVN